jgi:hypothetical protein
VLVLTCLIYLFMARVFGWLVFRELAQRGPTASLRAIEGWAAKGLTPTPIRRSLGRGRGTVSEYPPGDIDQHAAVAAVTTDNQPSPCPASNPPRPSPSPTDSR